MNPDVEPAAGGAAAPTCSKGHLATVRECDRCSHRNDPLSRGRVIGTGPLGYGSHGWQLDGTGACRKDPGLLGEPADAKAHRVPAFAAASSSPAAQRDRRRCLGVRATRFTLGAGS